MQCVPSMSDFFLDDRTAQLKSKTPSKKPFKVYAAANLGITSDQMMALFNGFLDGAELRAVVPDLSDCTANSTAIVVAIRAAINDFSKPNATIEDIADGITQIGIAIQGIANVTTSCKRLPESLSQMINYFLKIVNDPAKWFKLVTENATKNSMWIMWNLYSLDSLIKSEDYKSVGTKLGEVFKWIFQVDLGTTFKFMLFKAETTVAPNNGTVECIGSLYSNAPKLYAIFDEMGKGKIDIDQVFRVYAIVQDVWSHCQGIFSFPNFVALPQQSKLGKMPSIDHILDCVKSVKPFATDVYTAIQCYMKGDTAGAMNALTQAGIDAVGVGATCYKVVQDIISN